MITLVLVAGHLLELYLRNGRQTSCCTISCICGLGVSTMEHAASMSGRSHRCRCSDSTMDCLRIRPSLHSYRIITALDRWQTLSERRSARTCRLPWFRPEIHGFGPLKNSSCPAVFACLLKLSGHFPAVPDVCFVGKCECVVANTGRSLKASQARLQRLDSRKSLTIREFLRLDSEN